MEKQLVDAPIVSSDIERPCFPAGEALGKVVVEGSVVRLCATLGLAFLGAAMGVVELLLLDTVTSVIE